MTDKWKGFYTCENGYPDEDCGKPFAFQIDWMIEDGRIKGSSQDEECKDLFSEPASIEGFIDGDFVSFIKKYPSCWGYDQEHNLCIIQNLPAPEIHFAGNFTENYFEGVWEMTLLYTGENKQRYEINYSGTWLMEKEQSGLI